MPMSDDSSITVFELAELLKSQPQICLIDVREPEEHALASISGSELIPLSTLPAQTHRWSLEQPIYVHCKAGGRSARAVQFLKTQGFTQATNVSGGMDAWLEEGLPVSKDDAE